MYIRHKADKSHVFVTFALPYQAAFCPSINLQRYRQVSNIRRTLVGNLIDDHSDVVGASPVGAAPTTWQFNWWSLRCSWSIACRRCSNYIFILNSIPGFNGLGKDNNKMRRKAFKFWVLVRLILETLRYISVTWGWADLLGATEPIHASHVRTITRPVLCFCRDRLLSIAEHGLRQWDNLLHIFPLSKNLPSHWEKKM